MSIRTDEREWADDERLQQWMWDHITDEMRRLLVFAVMRWWLFGEPIRPERRNEVQVFNALRTRGLITWTGDSRQKPSKQGLLVVKRSVRFEADAREWMR